MLDYTFLKLKRKENRYSCREIAKILGFKTAAAYWKLEKGKSGLKCKELEALAQLYNQPIERFFKDKPVSTIQNGGASV
jgi:transcriptional regulator with XRE-family HTH domain